MNLAMTWLLSRIERRGCHEPQLPRLNSPKFQSWKVSRRGCEAMVRALQGNPPQNHILTIIVQAIRDMEYMYKLNSVTKNVQLRTQGRLESLFRDFILPEAFRTGYLVFPNSSLAAREPDLIREFMRKHLWYRLTWSDEERGRRPEGYYAHEAPEGYSSTVDWLARIVVAFTAGASVVVPIVIMTVPSSSKTKDLIVLSVAVIIFGVSVSWILQSRNMDTLAVLLSTNTSTAEARDAFVGSSQFQHLK